MYRVLIVEDDPMVAMINEQYVRKHKQFQVVGSCRDGKAALEFLEYNEADLMILDVFMPQMDGFETLRQIRKRKTAVDVIMVTAANEREALEEALHLGIVDYLIKPFSYERLRDTVLRFRDKLSLRQGVEKANQEMVDKLMGKRTPKKANDDLPKGLNARTLTAIREVIDQSPNGEHTCESISAASGLSRVTVRHYLNYLIERDVLTSSIDYETGGRPRVLYKLK